MGRSAELAKAEVEMLYPTISLPVMTALFDFGKPMFSELEGGEKNGVSISADDQGKAPKVPTLQW